MEVVIASIGVAAIAGFLWGLKTVIAMGDGPLRRKLRKTPATRIGAVKDDELAKLVGRVRLLDDTLTAPLTGRRCVYFIAEVEESVPFRGLKTIIREARAVSFVLEDDSGRAIVDGTHARIALTFSRSQSRMWHEPTQAERAFLDAHGEDVQGWFVDRKFYYHEAIIKEGETLAVLGAGTREPDPDAPPTEAYRGEARTRLRLTSSHKYPLVISDDPSTTT